jgi:hypothetical protein
VGLHDYVSTVTVEGRSLLTVVQMPAVFMIGHHFSMSAL